MKAIEFKEQNVIIAKDQKEYQPLPAYVQPNGLVTFCLALNPDELAKAVDDGRICFAFLTFGRPLQPVFISLQKPEFPVDHRLMFDGCEHYWTPEGVAVYEFDCEAHILLLSTQVWITVATFGAPLQPVKII